MPSVRICVTLLVLLPASAPAGIVPIQLLGVFRGIAQNLALYDVENTHV
jgi:hypothetical protein